MNTLYIYLLCTIVIIVIVYAIYELAKLLRSKTKYENIKIDKAKLELVNVIQPWIQSNIERATELTLQKYINEVNHDRMKRVITIDQYNNIKYDIESYLYGAIPTSVNNTFIFRYMNKNQIDILINSMFRTYNNNFFTIIKEER